MDADDGDHGDGVDVDLDGGDADGDHGDDNNDDGDNVKGTTCT